MIKLVELIGTPSLQYHIDNGLSLHENVYRYSSDSFIQLFSEARDAHRDGKIKLNEEDIMFRGTCAEQYIPAYDKASSQWMSMLENGTIPLSLLNDATGVVRDEYSFQDDEDEFLDELSDEEIRLMMKDTPDIIH